MYSFQWLSNTPLCICTTAYSFICWWTSRLLPCPGYYKQCCDEHWGTCVSFPLCLLFNMLSRLVIAFLSRSKHLFISWLQSPSAVISEPKKIKSVTVSIVSPSICHEVMGPDAMFLVFWMLSFKSVFSTLQFHFYQEALLREMFLELLSGW